MRGGLDNDNEYYKCFNICSWRRLIRLYKGNVLHMIKALPSNGTIVSKYTHVF